MTVKVKINHNWSRDVDTELTRGFLGIVTDTHRRSAILTPKDTRALVNSGKIEPIVNGYKIKYGSSKVPYARRQYYENRRSSHWLGRAADAVLRSDLSKYFRIGK